MCVWPIEGPLGIPRIEGDDTFLATVLPIEKFASGSRVNSRSQSTATRVPSNKPQSRTNESRLAGYPKKPGFDVRFGSKADIAEHLSQLKICTGWIG
jgi:hypothetical protein